MKTLAAALLWLRGLGCIVGLHPEPLLNIAYRMTRAEKRRHPGRVLAVVGRKCGSCGRVVIGTDELKVGNA